MELDFENITVFPELIEDAILYVLLFVALAWGSKAVYDHREKRRLEREFAAYQQRKDDEAQEGI